MKKKNITIDDLAVMVQKGFNEVSGKMATRADMNARFNDVNKRFDRIEKLILENHKRRIEKLETEIKELKELFAV